MPKQPEDAVLDGINNALGTSENNPQNPDNPYSYAALKEFEAEINRTEERIYLQAGYTRKLKPQAIEVLLQEPDATIVVKKRQFSSLAENYRLNLLDSKTRTYIKAVKRLFFNKCRAIAAYERLTKLDKIYHRTNGQFDDVLFPLVLATADAINSVSTFSSSNFAVLDTLKKVKYLSDPQYFTTWTPSELPYLADVGDGEGTFELTLAASLSTTVSTQFGGGSANIEFENPLELMIITQEDIEQAISDVVGFTNNIFFNFTKSQLRQQIQSLTDQLTTERMARGVSRITISDSPNTLNFKKIRAFIDEEGREIIFSYNPGLAGLGGEIDLDATAYQGPNGLKDREIDLFNQIILNYYSLLDNEKLTENQIREFNQQNDYVRKKMRLEFEDRPIIQQQDLVHIFISSKTSVEPRISAGFNFSFTENNVFNQADKLLSNIDDLFSQIKAPVLSNGENFVEIERNAIVGPQFPLWMWVTMRNEFTRQAAGTHVFAGIVDNASQQYSNGKHTVNVSCKDFTEFLNKGQLNVQPALDVIDSSIFDPLTPFKTDYDPASGILQGEQPELLDENKAILATQLVKFKAGRSRGQVVDIDTYALTDVEILTPESPEAKKRVKFFDPDGFVYRWKEGIGSLVLSGAPHKLGTGSLRKETSTLVTSSPWQGQDIMNTLSLLITGQPYNFSTFLKAASNSGFITNDKRISYSSSENFLKGLISDIKKNNTVWGNFIPFKRVTLPDATYQAMLTGEYDVSVNTNKINKLLKEKAERIDALSSQFSQSGIDPRYFRIGANNTPVSSPSTAEGSIPDRLRVVGTSIYKLDVEITNAQNSLMQSINNKNLAGKTKIKIWGDDISIEEAEGSSVSTEVKIREREKARKKLLFLTQRRLWKVKANDDPNFFIVDDSYDKNYDIQAFEDSLAGNPNLFKSTYDTIGNLAKKAADILDLELFADSQGHINARAPAYNRIPSSVLFELIRVKDQKGIKLFPEFFESLFFNQIKGLTDKIEVLEDRIRLRAALLGANSDYDIGKLLGGSQEANGGNAGFFYLVTDADTGRIDANGFGKLILQSSPDFADEANKKALSAVNAKLTTAASLNVQFDIIKRIDIISNPLKKSSYPDPIKNIIQRLENKFFIDPLAKDIANYRSSPGYLKQVKILELFSQLVPLVNERQNVLKLLVNAIKNLDQGTSINTTDVANSAIFTTLNSKSKFANGKIPEVLLHMVEDENVDDLGKDSGSRYIIKDSHLISFSISEKPPEYTVVEVNGSISNKLTNEVDGLGVGTNGNLMNTAIVADYDMWRLYGFKGTHPFDVAYLSNPEAQCAPFGVFRLNQARKKIFTADVTVKGNEYIQAGEVYYLESRDLLMYAESVSHEFSWDGSFRTRLNCTYVRKPGEFIPTMLDIIGKGLYTRKNVAELVKNSRNSTPGSDVPIAVLKANGTGKIDGEDYLSSEPPETGSYKEINRKAISSILLNLQGTLSASSFSEARKIQLRIYGANSVDSNLKKEAEEFRKLILNPEKFIDSSSSEVTVPDDYAAPKIEEGLIEVVEVLLGKIDPPDPRSPSSSAFELVRTICSYSSQSDNNKAQEVADAIKNNLFSYVIDVWSVKASALESGKETSSSKNDSTNQNQQQKEEELKKQIDQKLKALADSLNVSSDI